MELLEDHLELIEKTVNKYSYVRNEPVRDRMEFSIACEAFLEASLSFDPSKCHLGKDGFKIYVCVNIKRRIMDWKRSEHGRKGQKILSTCSDDLLLNTLQNGDDRLESMELCDVVCSLPKQEFDVVLSYFTNGIIPRDGYHIWCKAKASMRRKLRWS